MKQMNSEDQDARDRALAELGLVDYDSAMMVVKKTHECLIALHWNERVRKELGQAVPDNLGELIILNSIFAVHLASERRIEEQRTDEWRRRRDL